MKSLLTFIREHRFAKSESGAALAELAIMIPFLVAMVAAVTELGRLFQTYTDLSKATRVAARNISNVAYTSQNIASAKNVAVCGKGDCTGLDPVVPNLTADNVDITAEYADCGGCGNPGNPIRVTVSIVNYNFHPIFNLGALIGNDRLMALPASGSTTMYYMWVDPAGATP
jgi:Flp pilus assembly protein TadG